ncbi:putative protease YdcP [Tepidimonas sediminis]|uniref:Putative protease YdcP n=1 Tax=Tepidimonas sediminis TaxID=2588941 RepID=A0A554WV63_9BURK|nr:U32 family peptidase [Tepidimonas sediminis]TSE27470.1 putative protease YdcP [Tepidimonas sediminis]
MLPHQIELLSPARDADIGIEAVNHGADAVYIGGPGFGARANAANPLHEIERLVRHAHRYHARVFVTLNTILRDDELEAARRLAWQCHEIGVDALIVQDMGLLELDLPPIELHASTQCDIRTPQKARFLQDVGFSQIVLARELTLEQIAAIDAALGPRAAPQRAVLEFFIHGALCVAYSGQCYVSHAYTGRSANRGDCSQACRLPWEVRDAQGRILARDKHVLSMKDNNQSANLRALIDAGVRSFKIEGRYKDMGYVKNVTAHYRRLLDAILEERPELAPSSSGRCTCTFTPDPDQNFNREFTDYFVRGRQLDIGAFDSPKNPGRPIGWVVRVAADHVEIETDDPATELANGDGLCYFDARQQLVGLQTNRVERLGPGTDGGVRWRVEPKDAVATLRDLKRGTRVHRNRSMAWERLLQKKSAERRIGLHLRLHADGDDLVLTLTDADGHGAEARLAGPFEPARDAERHARQLTESLTRLGETIFAAASVELALPAPWFVPASRLNELRRAAVQALLEVREAARPRGRRRPELQPPVPYPDDVLTYLGNVYNHKARDFYARHGVRVIEAAYESHEALGEVSLMITRHCVRYSLHLCPKQAKGVAGVQGTIRAEPLTLEHGDQRLTLRFDCKRCEMHVVGRLQPHVRRQLQQQVREQPLRFYRTRPLPAAARA